MSLNPLFIRSQFQILYTHMKVLYAMSLNPLFIRSQFQIEINTGTDALRTISLNPLFIRSQFQIKHIPLSIAWLNSPVSIPYSSGLSFRWSEVHPMLLYMSTSQSLIHQVSVSDASWRFVIAVEFMGLNPLFIRSQFQILISNHIVVCLEVSQSLIHQVSVSD